MWLELAMVWNVRELGLDIKRKLTKEVPVDAPFLENGPGRTHREVNYNIRIGKACRGADRTRLAGPFWDHAVSTSSFIL